MNDRCFTRNRVELYTQKTKHHFEKSLVKYKIYAESYHVLKVMSSQVGKAMHASSLLFYLVATQSSSVRVVDRCVHVHNETRKLKQWIRIRFKHKRPLARHIPCACSAHQVLV